MMKRQFEDWAGKLLLIALFTWIAIRQTVSIAAIVRDRAGIEHWQMIVVSSGFSLLFVLLVVYYTIARLPPRDSATGIEPRVTAIAGTFITMLLVTVPARAPAAELQFASMGLIVVGTVLSIYCLFWLGRSFSIMASARGLVTQGPYAWIRHPLYAAEEITVIGIVMAKWSALALAVGVVHLALQLRRIHHEERVLRRTFVQYESYARRVPMIVPRSAVPRFRTDGT
jgi:protein-S-isoprenylcysteine O-methyltransferase Ste14